MRTWSNSNDQKMGADAGSFIDFEMERRGLQSDGLMRQAYQLVVQIDNGWKIRKFQGKEVDISGVEGAS